MAAGIFLGRKSSKNLCRFVEVSFEKAADEAERDYLNNIGTNFNIYDEEVDRLISAAGEILRLSPEFKAFLEANDRGVEP